MSIKIAPATYEQQRFVELDIWRGLAVVGMVLLHAAYVSQVILFNSFALDSDWGLMSALLVIGRMSAVSFLLLVGVSGYLSAYRKKMRSSRITRSFLLRGAALFGWASAISLVTWLFIPDYYVRFGILHLIAVGVVCMPLFVQVPARRLIALLILAGWISITFGVDQPPASELWLPFGVVPSTFSTVDYWPLVPWLLVIIVGVELGNYLYANGARNNGLSKMFVDSAKNSAIPHVWRNLLLNLSWIGQHALTIYLTHVPLLVLLFLLIKSVFQSLPK